MRVALAKQLPQVDGSTPGVRRVPEPQRRRQLFFLLRGESRDGRGGGGAINRPFHLAVLASACASSAANPQDDLPPQLLASPYLVAELWTFRKAGRPGIAWMPRARAASGAEVGDGEAVGGVEGGNGAEDDGGEGGVGVAAEGGQAAVAFVYVVFR